jgi:hypothetical protein
MWHMRSLGRFKGSVFAIGLLGPTAMSQTKRFDYVHSMLPPDRDWTTAVAIGDVDGDLDADVLVGSQSGIVFQQNRLYVNDGSAVFRDATSQMPPMFLRTRSLALGDVDGDSDLDLLIGNGGSPFLAQQNRLYVNDGSGVFSDATTQLPSIVDNTQALALGDVDGDLDLDILVGNGGGYLPGEQNRLHLNNGSGVFTDATNQLPPLVDATGAVVFGDFDSDLDLDLAIGNDSQTDRLLLNDGSGIFTETTNHIPPFADNTQALAVGDVDGDFDLDLLLGILGQDRLYLNDGTGTFSDATLQLPQVFVYTQSVALVDVDGDGDLDGFMGNGYQSSSPYQNRLYLNDGSGLFSDGTAQLPQFADNTAAVALVDVDGDLDPDAFIGNGFPFQDRLQLNDGSGTFVDVTTDLRVPVPPSFDSTGAVALGDVDGDADLDVLAGNDNYPFGEQNRLYLNDGSGRFSDATSQLPSVADVTGAVGFGDVDGDSDLDALIGNNFPDLNRLYLNDGAGSFSDATTQLPTLPSSAQAIALGDVDADLDPDALIGNNAHPDRLYLNDGSGVFSDGTAQLPANPTYTQAVALGDVDGDVDLDAFVGSPFSSPNRLYLNDGAGLFTDASVQLPPMTFSQTVALGDMDGDFDLDIVAASDFQSLLLVNNGSGTFSSAPGPFPSSGGNIYGVALGDVDGDGDLDVLFGCGNGHQNLLYRNNGSGTFSNATSQLPQIYDQTNAVALGDMDGDSDLDAWIANSGQDRIMTNLTRHLAWRGVPRIGKPLTLEVRGPAGGVWFLAGSLGTASLPVPPLGTLHLDPSTFYLLGSGALDADGRAAVMFPVPANPLLVGATVYWQALVAGPALLTNLETTTLTNL